ncbi:SH3 domain-containing kinase-binding protein 1 isoform X3 [Drosophila ananassae]|uniref:SH3 domain-containing kinase-binding protein 1 isoform X3 n=1 Tax=Drosophila ananassae TaxID=7217 RepID=UPI0013A5DCCA|nr:SH3 domain-containing kinase-binding protein 1 isoform X3 [Drosophila ananassae]
MDNNVCAIVEYEYAAKESDELDLHKGAIIHRIKQMPGGWWQGTLKATGATGMFPDNFVRLLDAGISSNGNGSGGDHSDEGTGVQLRDKAATSNRRCKVIYSYTQVNDDELTLAVGDVIEFLGEVEEGWWRGRLRTKVGVFPSNFVQHIEPSPILASKRPPTIGATVTTSSLSAKASNVAASITSSSTGATAPATTTTSNTSKQATKSRALAAPPAPAESAAIASAAVGAGVPGAPMLPPKPQRDYCRVEFPYAPQNDDELELKVDDIITVITTELPDKGWWKGELRGKVGVFPDNFVKMMAPSEVAPINEPTTTTTQAQSQSQRKIGNINSTTSSSSSHHMTTTNSSNSSTTTVTTQQKEQVGGTAASTTSKVYIKKTGSSNNSTTSSTTTTASSSAGRKESFGSRDSLNDILSETGLSTGNVAATRKSLENKNLDLTKPPGAAISQQRSSTSSATLTTTVGTGLAASAVSKSLENMDEKVKSPPPPVLSKKPSVPLKKTPTGGVPMVGAGNILGGKKKNPDGKLTSAVSHDLADGLTASKLVTGANQLPDAGAPGNLVMRRAATIAVEDTDFDRVERASILTDMRQGRVKAPKRRPPSAAINVLGESNNNSVYVNGSGTAGGAGSASEMSEDGGKPAASSDDNSTGEEPQLAKPKPREWEKKKAPWMEELKASQVTRKKTSPSVEPRGATVAERTSKLFTADQAISSSISSSSSSTTSKVQSSAVTSSMYAENTSSSSVTTSSTSSTSAVTVTANDAIMSRSLSAAKAAASSDEETKAARPNSLAIRNQRSVSPLVKSSNASSSQSQEEKPSLMTNHQEPPANKVNQLETRIEKLESLVQNQQRTIEELVNALKSEAERVKILRSELDKYAQKQPRRGKFDNWMF